MNNIINQVSKSTGAQISDIMERQAKIFFCNHADSIIEKLQEKALNNKGSMQISVPIKMLVVHDAGELEIKPTIDFDEMETTQQETSING